MMRMQRRMDPVETKGSSGLAAVLLLAAALMPVGALAETAASPPAANAGAPAERDCSRWPVSVFDDASASCVCPSGMWWNLRGDACLPREHAATEFCKTVWPGSEPFFVSGGGYRCVCAPPMIWDAQATACRPASVASEADCTKEWPTTLPVISPSGTEFECRCPGGRRWDETSRSCVPGAPVVVASRGFTNEGDVPAAPLPRGENGSLAPSYAPSGNVAPPAAGSPPPDGADRGAGAPGGGVPAARAGGNSAVCDPLIAEIRGRAGAGQTSEADALGMRAAVAGCDPAAIAEAARTKPAAR